MPNALHTVVETPEFLRRAQGLLTAAERNPLVNHLAANPDAGDLMRGAGVCADGLWKG